MPKRKKPSYGGPKKKSAIEEWFTDLDKQTETAQNRDTVITNFYLCYDSVKEVYVCIKHKTNHVCGWAEEDEGYQGPVRLYV